MRYYLQTKFRGNLRGSSVFRVDLAWNDPHVEINNVFVASLERK